MEQPFFCNTLMKGKEILEVSWLAKNQRVSGVKDALNKNRFCCGQTNLTQTLLAFNKMLRMHLSHSLHGKKIHIYLLWVQIQ